ncbi:hypothetical protein [Candidatus Nitrosacidococcus tergens]|uniref:Uncharacterized protein n=1 Tax=Candidatus Nitrosacidococcus tergens TaxID=553981 RepID=A0A7G1QBL4_9GAMM|nr:hypothetical protein [Candidatus Nitrosacidococcus tergens]CAB1276717.1 protein of unknown function [Candidatus Nitrosacidococcus tergens]
MTKKLLMLVLSIATSINIAYGTLIYNWVPNSQVLPSGDDIWITGGQIIIHGNSYQLGSNYNYSIPSSAWNSSSSALSGGGINMSDLQAEGLAPEISFSFDLMDKNGVKAIASFNGDTTKVGGSPNQSFNSFNVDLNLDNQLFGSINIQGIYNNIDFSTASENITVGADAGNFCGGNTTCGGGQTNALGLFTLAQSSSIPEPHVFWLFNIGFFILGWFYYRQPKVLFLSI